VSEAAQEPEAPNEETEAEDTESDADATEEGAEGDEDEADADEADADSPEALVEIPEEPTWLDAPVAEALPLIGDASWVRFKASKGIPRHAVGRDGVVTYAPRKRAPGGDTLSDTPYEYQDGTEVFTVRLRDTGELIQCTRAAFATFDSDVARLAVA